MKYFYLRPNKKKFSIVYREQAGEFDVIETGEAPSDENILKGLRGLLAIYEAYCDTRENVAAQGNDIIRTEAFFTHGRIVKIGNFTITVTTLNQLETLIITYQTRLNISPEPQPFNGFVKGPGDLPEHIAI